MTVAQTMLVRRFRFDGHFFQQAYRPWQIGRGSCGKAGFV